MKYRLTGAAAVAALALAPLSAQADDLYRFDFETGNAWSEWSNPLRSFDPAFSTFLGRFSLNHATTLTLPALPEGPRRGETYMLGFTLYVIDSWDGSDDEFGLDEFYVNVNSRNFFSETLANQHDYQTYRDPDVPRQHLAYDNRWVDSVYYITIPFEAAGPQIRITFGGYNLQGIADESWGLDNVRVFTAPVPGPSGALALAVGVGVFGGRRRR